MDKGSASLARLSPQERLALIGNLWDSLDDADVVLTPAQQEELGRRLAALGKDRDAAVAWPEFRDQIRQRLG